MGQYLVNLPSGVSFVIYRDHPVIKMTKNLWLFFWEKVTAPPHMCE
jgi:hypothetical protein